MDDGRPVYAASGPDRAGQDERGRMTAAIDVHGLTKRFGEKTAVDAIDFAVQPGEFLGFLGPNGAGKSTTINMLVGLVQPDKGTASICGDDIRARSLASRAHIGVVPEDLNLYTRLTGREFIDFVGAIYGVSASERRRRTGELLDVLGLADDADKMIIDYSHGMQKKTSLAAAIVHVPRVLFLDEPFEGVDALSRRTIHELLGQLRRRGTTIFFSSHILEVVEKLCSRVIVIAEGNLVADGTVDELRARADTGEDSTLEDVFLSAVGAETKDGKLSWLE